MNWAGFGFGASATIAVLGAAVVAVVRGAAPAIAGFALSMLGVAGVCLTLGDDFLAILIVLVMSAALPAGLLAAAKIAPAAARPPRRSRVSVAIGIGLAAFAGLTALVLGTEWPPAGGQRETAAVWVGWGLLTDSVAALELVGALLAVAAIAALVLARAATGPREVEDRSPRP